MSDYYEMPAPPFIADNCPHAGVGKACHPCRKLAEAAMAEGRKAAVARVRSIFNIQCPPKDPDKYVDHGAYLAHDWWNTVLGGLLEDLEAQ